jgi:nucleoside-diphosphate-sugar epimerase
VLPALIRKFHEAKEKGQPYVEVWGSGTPRREFLHADDLADACLFLMQTYDDSEIVNIGVGEDISIAELAELIREVVGYEGELRFDRSKPDGTPPQAAGCGTAPFPGLAGVHSPARRHRTDLPLVSGKFGKMKKQRLKIKD